MIICVYVILIDFFRSQIALGIFFVDKIYPLFLMVAFLYIYSGLLDHSVLVKEVFIKC